MENETNVYSKPALSIPDHIELPDYITDPNAEFGVYDGKLTIHNVETIDKLRESARIVSKTLERVIENEFKAGDTTDGIDELVHNSILSEEAYPTPIGFMNFPRSVCTSVNDVLCHGIPNNKPLENGDFINVDVTCYKNGVHGDSSVMIEIGEVREEIKELIQYTQSILYTCIQNVQ